MIDKLKYIVAGSLMLVLSTNLVACDDDPEEMDAWSSTYAYIERPVLGVNSISYVRNHSSLGIDPIVQPLVVRLNRPYKSDVVLKLACKTDGELPEDTFVFQSGGTVTIPAGEVFVCDTLYTDTDWDFVVNKATTYTGELAIESVAPASGNLLISEKIGKIPFSIVKAAFADLVGGIRPEGARIADRSAWIAKSGKSETDIDNWKAYSELTNGQNSDYVWFDTPHLGVLIDMGVSYTLSGIENYGAFGSGYSMSSCVIYTSEDGVNWTLQTSEGEKLSVPAASTVYVKFIKPLTARYIRWHMYGTSCLSSEVYCWTKAQE